MLDEARHDRRYPGEGELWLDQLLDVVPADMPVSLEVPRLAVAGRSARERAELAGQALGRFLGRYEARASPGEAAVTA